VAVKAADPFVTNVMAMIELNGLVDRVELIRRVRRANEPAEEEGNTDAADDREHEPGTNDSVRPGRKERNHPAPTLAWASSVLHDERHPQVPGTEAGEAVTTSLALPFDSLF
jgi:hypothetical protein